MTAKITRPRALRHFVTDVQLYIADIMPLEIMITEAMKYIIDIS